MSTLQFSDALDLLDRAVSAVCGTEVVGLDEPSLTYRMDRLHRAQARLVAERARLVAELEDRRTRRTDGPRERERARQDIRRELADRSNRSRSQTKLDAQAGAAARQHTATGQAFADGQIGAEHVRLIAEVLDALPDQAERQDLEQELLDLARVSPPPVFGRQARERLAQRAPVSVALREERQQRERRVTAADTPDGGVALSGIVYGTAAETLRTALDAFRRPDIPGELRTPAQRTADALEQLCDTALRAGGAPARHGVRPQVLLTVTTDQLDLGEDGIAYLASGELTTVGRVRHLLDDCSWARVILAPDGTPLEASASVRTVPAGLWRALLARDGGCTWAGCDAPASWCDVAHGRKPFAAGGRLSPDNSALLCRRHHRRFDHGGYRIHIEGGQVTYRRIRDRSHPESMPPLSAPPPPEVPGSRVDDGGGDVLRGDPRGGDGRAGDGRAGDGRAGDGRTGDLRQDGRRSTAQGATRRPAPRSHPREGPPSRPETPTPATGRGSRAGAAGGTEGRTVERVQPPLFPVADP
ncbi:MAG: DUF222 domain-containing protein [Nitriliruptoraceae bacterium]